jgi:hypothetical protein
VLTIADIEAARERIRGGIDAVTRTAARCRASPR